MVHLDKAAVEGQVVSDGILPGSLVGAVVRKPLHDELVDARQGDPLLWTLLDGHGNQGYVAEAHTHTLLEPVQVERSFTIFFFFLVLSF